jgi:hypothetical protein
MTYIDKKNKQPKLPHIDFIKKTNPESQIYIIVGKDSGYGKYYDWKNSDQQLRNWWKNNNSQITNDTVAIIEWDTLIGCKIPEMPKDLDLVGKSMFIENINIRNKWQKKIMKDPSWTTDNWFWWPEIPLLELNDNQKGIGLISFGFYLIKKWVLNCIIDEKWDNIFKKNIQNELRFPTIASLCGAKIGTIELPFVEFYDVKVTEKAGIYHGVNETFSNEFKY